MQEIIRQAAEAATGLLPKLRQDRSDLDARIASLEAVKATWEALSGSPHATKTGKRKRGEAAEHVNAILSSGSYYKEPDLRKTIAQRFNVVYGRPTIYTVLRRGREAGKYEQKEKRWGMKVA